MPVRASKKRRAASAEQEDNAGAKPSEPQSTTGHSNASAPTSSSTVSPSAVPFPTFSNITALMGPQSTGHSNSGIGNTLFLSAPGSWLPTGQSLQQTAPYVLLPTHQLSQAQYQQAAARAQQIVQAQSSMAIAGLTAVPQASKPGGQRGDGTKSEARKCSKYKGVSWDKTMRAWRCKINSVHVGYFDDEKEAACAYDEASVAIRGRRGNVDLNFPENDYSEVEKSGHDTSKFASRRETASRRGTSSYRGVLWDKVARTWRAKIKFQGKTKYLGLHHDEISAARAYDRAAVEFRGRGAQLNFPGDYHDQLEGSSSINQRSMARSPEELTRQAEARLTGQPWTEESLARLDTELTKDSVLAQAVKSGKVLDAKSGTSIHAVLVRLAAATGQKEEACAGKLVLLRQMAQGKAIPVPQPSSVNFIPSGPDSTNSGKTASLGFMERISRKRELVEKTRGLIKESGMRQTKDDPQLLSERDEEARFAEAMHLLSRDLRSVSKRRRLAAEPAASARSARESEDDDEVEGISAFRTAIRESVYSAVRAALDEAAPVLVSALHQALR